MKNWIDWANVWLYNIKKILYYIKIISNCTQLFKLLSENFFDMINIFEIISINNLKFNWQKVKENEKWRTKQIFLWYIYI